MSEARFEELKAKSFELFLVTEMLCEICKRQLGTRKKLLKQIKILSGEDYMNIRERAIVHDRAEVDIEKGKIYFYDHDFPGDVHPECIEKL